MNRREFLAGSAGLLLSPRLGRADEARWEKSFTVMDTWFWEEKDLDVAAQVALLQRLGCSGMTLSWGQKHAERLAALRDRKMEMPGIFVTADIDGDPSASLSSVVEFLKGSGGLLWLALTSRKHPMSDADGDDAAAAGLAKVADLCRTAGLPGIALYPHAGLWMERVADSVRLAAMLKRPDVGVVFNQYHWMATEPGQAPRKRLESAAPHLKAVTINGSAKTASVLPLGEGDYDPAGILRMLLELKYAGPISHQGFGIKGGLEGKLKSALAAWEDLKKRAREVPPDAMAAHVHISGIVQGVSFRASTQAEARKLGVKGWVMNLADGRVEALLQGPKDKVEELLRWCRKGPPSAKVDKVEVVWEKSVEEFLGFDIRP
jgi:acylphosphatase